MQRIADKAGRNAFIATALALGGLTIGYGYFLQQPVPVNALAALLGLAFSVYALSDVRLRRASRQENHAEGPSQASSSLRNREV